MKSKLISIWDFEILPNKKLKKESLYLTEALNRMMNRNQFHEESYEDVIDPFELMLVLEEVSDDFNNKKGNDNATR